jgi:hypothetical protein
MSHVKTIAVFPTLGQSCHSMDFIEEPRSEKGTLVAVGRTVTAPRRSETFILSVYAFKTNSLRRLGISVVCDERFNADHGAAKLPSGAFPSSRSTPLTLTAQKSLLCPFSLQQLPKSGPMSSLCQGGTGVR